MTEYPSSDWTHYELIDSGNGLKLERYGSCIMTRPEPKAIWEPSLPQSEWRKMSWTVFHPGAGFGKAGKEDTGVWERLREMPDQWQIRYAPRPDGPAFNLRLGLTAFKHVGVFPEQAPNWQFIYDQTRRIATPGGAALAGVAPEDCATLGNMRGGTACGGVGAALAGVAPEDCATLGNMRGGTACGGVGAADVLRGNPRQGGRRPRILNLFAYTGGASLAAACAGAEVTHLDSVRQVVNWASDNASRSSLDGIHWVVEDAMKFACREKRRAHRYDGIILDPPAYGHGPDGEKWKLDECLFEMLKTVSSILEPKDSFLVLNLYSNGYSPLLGETVLKQAFSLRDGEYRMQSGELSLLDRFGKALPLSIFIRLER